MCKIKLGVKAKDSITGFSGVITGRVEYITGCCQSLITPKAVKNDHKDSVWFDDDRIVVSKSKKVVKKTVKNVGFGAPTPIK